LIFFLGVLLILVAGMVLLVLAERWDWKPSLMTTLVVAALARIAIVLLTARTTQPVEVAGLMDPALGQPLDFGWGMPLTGTILLEGRDPQVNYFPLLSYIYAAHVALVHWTGVSWVIVGKLYSVVADVVLVWLIGLLATDRPELRRWQYACLPLALLVSGIHAQMEPFVLAFGVAGLLYARRQRPAWAGVLLGVAIAAKTWPVILGTGFLRALKNNKSRLVTMVASAGVPLAFLLTYQFVVDTSVTKGLSRVIGYGSYVGEWGWTGLIRVGFGDERFFRWYGELRAVGKWVTLAGLLIAWWLWRRANPIDLTAAVTLGFLVFASGFGAQYLLWPVPFLLAYPTRRTVPFLAVASAWATVGYLLVGDFGYYVLWRHSGWWEYESVHLPWIASSVVVVLACFAAFPWERRTPRIGRRQASLLERA
jgi:hypothetical protein